MLTPRCSSLVVVLGGVAERSLVGVGVGTRVRLSLAEVETEDELLEGSVRDRTVGEEVGALQRPSAGSVGRR